MLVFFARSGARHPVLPVALGFLLGGSISNLVDRVRLGHVTDFLDLRYWPAFNLADSSSSSASPSSSRALAAAPTERSTGRRQLATLRFRAPERRQRLDRFLAAPPEVGSRALAERLLAAGAVLVDGEAAAEEPPARGRGGGRRRAARRGAARSRRSRSTSASPARTSTCSSSTSRRASSSIRAPATRAARSCTGCSSTTPAGGDERPAGNRPPARPRHLGPARRRALRRGARAAAGGDPAARRSSGATSRSSRAARARAAAGSRRRSAATARTESRHSLDTTDAARGGDALRGRGAARPATRCSTSRSRPGRTHQIRVHLEAIDLPVVRRPGLRRRRRPRARAPVPARAPARVRPPVHRRSGSTLESPLPERPRSGARAQPATAQVLSWPRYTVRASFLPPSRRPGRVGVPGSEPGSARAPPAVSQPNRERSQSLGSRLHAGAPGGRSPLRPPDPPLEPEDEALHLHRARRHLHHRPAADLRAARGGLRLRAQHRPARRHDPLRRHEEAGAGRRRRARRRASACRTSTTAGSAAC